MEQKRALQNHKENLRMKKHLEMNITIEKCEHSRHGAVASHPIYGSSIYLTLPLPPCGYGPVRKLTPVRGTYLVLIVNTHTFKMALI